MTHFQTVLLAAALFLGIPAAPAERPDASFEGSAETSQKSRSRLPRRRLRRCRRCIYRSISLPDARRWARTNALIPQSSGWRRISHATTRAFTGAWQWRDADGNAQPYASLFTARNNQSNPYLPSLDKTCLSFALRIHVESGLDCHTPANKAEPNVVCHCGPRCMPPAKSTMLSRRSIPRKCRRANRPAQGNCHRPSRRRAEGCRGIPRRAITCGQVRLHTLAMTELGEKRQFIPRSVCFLPVVESLPIKALM
jgi:hypothetical protein